MCAHAHGNEINILTNQIPETIVFEYVMVCVDVYVRAYVSSYPMPVSNVINIVFEKVDRWTSRNVVATISGIEKVLLNSSVPFITKTERFAIVHKLVPLYHLALEHDVDVDLTTVKW